MLLGSRLVLLRGVTWPDDDDADDDIEDILREISGLIGGRYRLLFLSG